MALLALAAICAFVPGAAWLAPSHAASASTVVSLTFDDGQATQFQALAMLSSRGMAGTFYINSGLVGSSGYYMSWSQIQQLADAGNEIGGHTLTHPNLTKISTSEARREICDDRAQLQQRGFTAVSFAYPYAASNDTVKQLVRECGYSSARTVGNLYGPGCTSCAPAESIPPRDAYFVRTVEPVVNTTTLAELQGYVTHAESHGGGWVPFNFHAVCSSSCSATYSISKETFAAFLDWLQPRAAQGTVVRTVGETMGASNPGVDTTPPATSISCNGSACSDGWYQTAREIALTATDTGSGVTATTYTTDGSDPATSSSAQVYSGPFTVDATTTVRYSSVDDAGNRESAKTTTVRIDGVSPAVTLTSPADGSTHKKGSKVTLSASASDTGTAGGAPSGVTTVGFYLDGSEHLGTDNTAPYQLAWNTRKASLGGHTLTAVATDAAGNRTTSNPVLASLVR